MKPDYEFLRDVAAAFDGIPAERVDMNAFGYLSCPTLGCVAGHMVHHPVFNLGTIYPSNWWAKATDKIAGNITGEERKTIHALFAQGPAGEAGKQEFARRVISYLESNGQPVSEEYRRRAG